MLNRFTFEIERSDGGFTGGCHEVPAASSAAETFERCASNLSEAVETALLESESFLSVKTFTLAVELPEGTKHFGIKIIHSSEGYAIGCLDLSGCWSQGDTEEEAIERIREAIKDYFEVAAERVKEREQQLGKVA